MTAKKGKNTKAKVILRNPMAQYLMRTTVYAPHKVQWKHLPITIVLVLLVSKFFKYCFYFDKIFYGKAAIDSYVC